MVANFIEVLLTGFIGIVHGVVAPVLVFLHEEAPYFSDILEYVVQALEFICNFFPWIKSWFNIPVSVLWFACDVIIFSILGKIVVHSIKVAIAWWDKIFI